MMKSLFLFFAFLQCCATPLFAQIPNGSFENWTAGSPDNWLTGNTPPILTNITRISAAHAGSSAARGEVTAISMNPPIVVQPFLQSGSDGAGFPYGQRPAAFNGWYNFTPAGGSGDRLFLNAILFKGISRGTPIGIASTSIITATSGYKQFSVPFAYVSGESPDTCIIQIQIVGTTGQPHPGSIFVIDDLSLGAVTAAEQSALPSAFALSQNYPNPFNPTTAISYQLPAPSGAEGSAVSFVNLRVFDMLGREVATLAEGRKEAGRYTINWNASSLPSGMYLYQLTATSEKGEIYRDTKRAMLLK